MKRRTRYLDAFVLGGFTANFFTGFLNPMYVSIILARLDPRVIAAGSVLASALPVAMGLVLGRRRLFRRLSAVLPWVMLAELLVAVAAALSAAVDIKIYYLSSMLVMGIFSSCVVYLLQKVKEVRYRRNRAAFDRTCEMADALGYLAGSGLSIVGVVHLREPLAVAALGVLQTLLVYGLFLLVYRTTPAARGARADEEAHPWGGHAAAAA
jgi:hypothetical protein